MASYRLYRKNRQNTTARMIKFRSLRRGNCCVHQCPLTPELATRTRYSTKITIMPVAKVPSRDPEEILIPGENFSKLPKTKASYDQPKNIQILREQDKQIALDVYPFTKIFPKGSFEYNLLAILQGQLSNQNLCEGVSKSPLALDNVPNKPISKCLGNSYNTAEYICGASTSKGNANSIIKPKLIVAQNTQNSLQLPNTKKGIFPLISKSNAIIARHSVTHINEEPKDSMVRSIRSIKDEPKNTKMYVVSSTKEQPKDFEVYKGTRIKKELKNTRDETKDCSVSSSIKDEPIDSEAYSTMPATYVSNKTITKKMESNSSTNKKLNLESDGTSVEVLYVCKPKKSYGSISTNPVLSQDLFSVGDGSSSTSMVVKDAKCKPKLTYFRDAPASKKELVRPCKSEFIYAPDALNVPNGIALTRQNRAARKKKVPHRVNVTKLKRNPRASYTFALIPKDKKKRILQCEYTYYKSFNE